MLFSEIIGQKKIKDQLIRSVKDQRVSHAQLFTGPEGSGKLALAVAYAQYLSCTGRLTDDACGQCPACNKFQKLIHPDLHFVFPVNTNKKIAKNPVSDDFIEEWRSFLLENPYRNSQMWYEHIEVENKQGLISKFESESIIRKLSYKPYESEYKILIIWLPEKMNPHAANKLLKMIEEPPEKTLFLLISESTDQILPTILSRTQIIKVPKIDSDELHMALKKQYNLTDKELTFIVHLANGNYIRAVDAINKSADNEYNLDMFTKLTRLCYKNKIPGLITWAEEMAALGREKQKDFFDFAIHMIRENFIMNFNNPELVFLSREEYNFSDRFHPFINGGNVISISDEINRAYRHIEQNGNGRIIFLDFTLRLVKLIGP